MYIIHLYQIKRKTIQLSLDLLIGLASLQRWLYCGQFLNLTNWLKFKTCLINFLSFALLKLEFGVNWVHNYWVWIYINTSSLFTCWQRKQIWLISLLPLPHKGYSCVAMAYVVTDLWKNCLQNINRLSSCFFFYYYFWFVHCFRQWTHLQDDSFWRKTFPCEKKCPPLRNILHLYTFMFYSDLCVLDSIRFNDVLRIYSNVFEHVKWICA